MQRYNTKAIIKDFGAVIREKRKQKNLTQEQLSEVTGITETYLRDLEQGNYSATWLIWLRLCTVLDIDIDSFKHKYIKPELEQRIEKFIKT